MLWCSIARLFYGDTEGHVGSKTCDRRARSRSEQFGIDERATKWLVRC